MSAKVDVVVQPVYDGSPDRADTRVAFANCERCLTELQHGVTERGDLVPAQSPEQYARQQFGPTDDGWQVWCVRHQCNIVTITLQIKGQKES